MHPNTTATSTNVEFSNNLSKINSFQFKLYGVCKLTNIPRNGAGLGEVYE